MLLVLTAKAKYTVVTQCCAPKPSPNKLENSAAASRDKVETLSQAKNMDECAGNHSPSEDVERRSGSSSLSSTNSSAEPNEEAIAVALASKDFNVAAELLSRVLEAR